MFCFSFLAWSAGCKLVQGPAGRKAGGAGLGWANWLDLGWAGGWTGLAAAAGLSAGLWARCWAGWLLGAGLAANFGGKFR